MSAIDDHLLFSEGRVTDATLSSTAGDPQWPLTQAILALTESQHAHTLALQENTAAIRRFQPVSIRIEGDK